jgi:hypothetical protein
VQLSRVLLRVGLCLRQDDQAAQVRVAVLSADLTTEGAGHLEEVDVLVARNLPELILTQTHVQIGHCHQSLLETKRVVNSAQQTTSQC